MMGLYDGEDHVILDGLV